jgi:hypothetical protein
MNSQRMGSRLVKRALCGEPKDCFYTETGQSMGAMPNVSSGHILLKNSLIGEKGAWAEKLDVHNRFVFDDLASGRVSTYPGKTRF